MTASQVGFLHCMPSAAIRTARLAAIIVAVVLSQAPPAVAQAPADGRPVIRTQADLPRHTYALAAGSVAELLDSDAAFAQLTARVETDVEGTLSAYQIEDTATLRQAYQVLAHLAVLRGDHEAALERIDHLRRHQEKPSERLLAGIDLRAIIAAVRAGGDVDARRRVFRNVFEAEVSALPWAVVQDGLREMKGASEIVGRSVVLGMATQRFDPVLARGEVSGDVAAALIEARLLLDHRLDYSTTISEVLGEFIARHETVKEDIWPARRVDLEDTDGLTPVVIGIWDSGVDPTVFADQMLRSDEGDVLHVAFSNWDGAPQEGPLYPLSAQEAARYPLRLGELKGLLDLQTHIESAEAREMRSRLAALNPDEVAPFIEELTFFSHYMHGTHVAGIAIQGNPAARLVVVREYFPYTTIPAPLTREVAERWVGSMDQAVSFLRRYGTRIVNMSWGITAAQIESFYELAGIGATSDERKRLALEVYGILVDGMTRAMERSPEILFVPAAGNADNDVTFSMTFPSGIALPNVLTVAAVDQAGDETSFTSYGGTVRLYANGYEVESDVPGGDRLRASGTSMAAPAAVNLAAKLLALEPTLTPEDVIELMLDGADRTEDGRRVLINPRRSVELLTFRRLEDTSHAAGE